MVVVLRAVFFLTRVAARLADRRNGSAVAVERFQFRRAAAVFAVRCARLALRVVDCSPHGVDTCAHMIQVRAQCVCASADRSARIGVRLAGGWATGGRADDDETERGVWVSGGVNDHDQRR